MEKVKLRQKVENLESTVLTYKSQLEGLITELERFKCSINTITNWIASRFGVDLLGQAENQQFLYFSPIVNNYQHAPQNNDPPAKTQILINDTNKTTSPSKTLHQRSLQIKALNRKRRCSGQSQESAVNRYIQAQRDSSVSKAREKVIRESANQMDSTEKPEECIKLKTVSAFPSKQTIQVQNPTDAQTSNIQKDSIPNSSGSQVNNAGQSEKSVLISGEKDDTTITKSNINPQGGQRRGRPKKHPDEKVQIRRDPLVCDECGKIVKGGKGSLRSHKQTHSNARPFECDLCDKSFRRKHHLDFHRLTHGPANSWTCRFCDKGFIAQRDLIRHERTHTGEKPFSCPYTSCSKRFRIQQHVVLHSRVHTGERPYECEICKKKFSQANSLRLHRKIHTKGTDSDKNLQKNGSESGESKYQNDTVAGTPL